MQYSSEISDCKSSWYIKDRGLWHCPIHNTFFFADRYSPPNSCKYYDTFISTRANPSNLKKKTYPNGFTSDSQVNTSKLQGENCVSQVNRRKYVRKHDFNLYERFHNYGVRFDAVVQWEHLFKYDEIPLRNGVSYKRVDLPLAIVRVFKKSILVVLRSSNEIVGLDVKSAELKAISMVVDTLNSMPKAIKVSKSDVASIHNAFVNHPTAKLFKQVFGREMVVKDDAGVIHEFTDNSHGYHELEYPNTKTAIPMSERREQYEADLIFNNPDFPSIQDKKIRSNSDDIRATVEVLNDLKDNALKPLTAQLDLHLGVEAKQDKNMDLMNVNLEKQNELMEKQNMIQDKTLNAIDNLSKHQIKESNTVLDNRTYSKYDVERKEKIRKFIEEYR